MGHRWGSDGEEMGRRWGGDREEVSFMKGVNRACSLSIKLYY